MFPILIGNLRAKRAVPDGYRIRCDRRSGSPLGNPFHMRNELGRDKCLSEYDSFLSAQVARRNPDIIRALTEIGAIAEREPVVLMCWCFPKRCHCETVRRFVVDQLY